MQWRSIGTQSTAEIYFDSLLEEKMNKKWGYVALFLIIGMLFLVNCGGKGVEIVDIIPMLATSTPTLAPPTPIPASGLGIPISKGGWQLTVEEISTADSLRMGGTFGNSTTFTPNEGFAFLIVNVRIRNLDPTRSVSITQDNMAIIDENGTIKTADGGGWADDSMCAGCAFSVSQSVGSESMSGWILTQNNITFGGISPGQTIRFVYIVNADKLNQEWKLQYQEVPPFPFKLGDQVTHSLSSSIESTTSRLPVECTAENIQTAQTSTGVLFQAWEENQLVVKFAEPDGSTASEICKGFAFNKLTHGDDGAILMTAGPLQGWPNLYLLEPDGRTQILAQNALTIQASFVPGTKYVIFRVTQVGKVNPEIYLMDRESATEKLLFEGSWANYRVFSNGYVLLTGMPLDDSPSVELFGPLTDGEVVPVTLPEDVATGSIMDDGTHLLYSDYSGDTTSLYYSGVDGSNKKELLSGDLNYGDQFISPDEQLLLMSAKGELDPDSVQAVLMSLATKESISITPESQSVEYAFSADGQWVAAISTFKREESDEAKTQKQIMFIYNVKEAKVKKEVSGEIVNYLFSPDNAYLAYTLRNEDETVTISTVQLSDMSEAQLGAGILEGWNIVK